MKSKKHLLALLAVIVTIASVICFASCGDKSDNNGGKNNGYTISVNTDKSLALQVGDTVDFKQYFTVTDRNGNQIVVTDKMLDTSKVDTTEEGQFTVTLKAGGTSKSITFTVTKKDDDNGDNGDDPNADISAVFARYADSSKWNFAASLSLTYPDGEAFDEYYEYKGDDIKYSYRYYGSFTFYIGYEAATDTYYYYCDDGNGAYTKYSDETDEFWNFYDSFASVDLSKLKNLEFTEQDGAYSAKLPNDAGNAVIGEYDASTWTSFALTVKNGNIDTIVAVSSDNYTYEYAFSKFGTVDFTLPSATSSTGGNTTPTTPTGTMEKQTYNKDTFDDERLQSKMIKTGEYADPAIGLPSIGEYSALVIPVKFSDTTISRTQLENLNIAFNGTAAQTGWESVTTYYQKSSYGKLDISFDIAGFNIDGVDYYTSSKSSSYYAGLTETDDDNNTYNVGDNVLLHEALAYYENKLDLTKYDSNNDGTIDAVYLIYSAEVDYESDDSFYWAYVTWNDDETKYDGKSVYYYLFAGLDFMKESVQGGYTNEYYPVISGLKVNANTYIHETGHLFGLDDYYDYFPDEGSNEGLGGADMMDATVGDQNVYSKIMLGWLTPEIVVNTKTITIKSSQERGDAILIPLNFDNSYFCEYLLIDLYSAQGVNEMHSSVDNSYLYGGASYGVRIYHVSSWINNAFDNDYGSFTDNNNSLSDVALIKLVEADGESKFASSGGYADRSDLWQAGGKLSEIFPNYTTYGGKTLIFDITVVSVSETEATITITYSA